MSKIGNLPVSIPQGVTVKTQDKEIEVTGPKGTLNFLVRPEITVDVSPDNVKVSRKSDDKFTKALHGLIRSVIANMVKGVSEGHEKVLELVGVGYRAALQGDDLVLNIGYSHPVVVKPLGLCQIQTKENKIIISGIDKVTVGEMAARIRRLRPPEPYKGKGIKYEGEIIRRKAGKAAKTAGGTA